MTLRRLAFLAALATLASAWRGLAQEPPIWGADNVSIARMRRSEMVELRAKAWALFDEVRTAGLPKSPNWFLSSEVFERPDCALPVGPRAWRVHTPAEREWLGTNKGFAAEAAGDDRELFESTFFNQEACLDIHNKDFPLNELGTTRKLLQLQQRDIAGFRKGAKVIKTFWRPLPTDNSPIQVGLWRWPTAPSIDKDDASDKGEWLLRTRPEQDWADQVCVQMNPMGDSPCLRAEDHFPIAYVSKNDEFPCDKDCKADFQDGQPLILLAVHAISKESPDWLWATFWWKGISRTNGESWTCDNAQRAGIAGVWGNFSANVTTSFKLARPTVRIAEADTCGVPGTIGLQKHKEESLATYNPYVEGVMPEGGRKSSCIVCHARANTRGDVGVERFRIPPVGKVEWPPLTHFEGHIRTDYLWSVRNHIGPSREPE